MPVEYNPAVPPETFDVVIVDECHRSIYGLWRQVLDYFDAFTIGLTATPNKQAFGFFNQNLVMEYGHEQAVVDQVNVPFDVYRIRTSITEQGSTIDAGIVTQFRERQTRRTRWEKLDEELGAVEMFRCFDDADPGDVHNCAHAAFLLVRHEGGDRSRRLSGQVAIDIIMVDDAESDLSLCDSFHDLRTLLVDLRAGIILEPLQE